MPTEAGKRAARAAVERGMGKEDQASFAQRAGVSTKTLYNFLTAGTWPNRSTLAKIEVALGMIPGTLAATGEEQASVGGGAAYDLGDAELLDAFTLRFAQLRSDLEEARARIAELEAEAEKSTAAGGSVTRLPVREPGSRRYAADSGVEKLDDLEPEDWEPR